MNRAAPRDSDSSSAPSVTFAIPHATQIVDSVIHGHLWGTDEARSIFAEDRRLDAWLDIIAALAEAQADLGIIPEAASREIRSVARIDVLDLAFVAEETRATCHSTLGLIHALQQMVSPDTARWVYFGATVQDITDTWTALAMKRMAAIAYRDLRTIETSLLALARTHAQTPMAGRTHGQPGLPLTFGYKVAVWASEIRRHIERIRSGRARWETGQLGGAVGTLSFWGDQGVELRSRFLGRLGLASPIISWTTARDNVAEFLHLLAMATTTLAKIGNEVYELQRPEIGELTEPFTPGQVGSITMPHKRNPELSEHLDTLARLIRANSEVVTTGMVQQHERDGRGWKAEWLAFPLACTLASASLEFGIRLVAGLRVNSERMLHNLDSSAGYVLSEAVMHELSHKLGKERARQLVYEASMAGEDSGVSLADALREIPDSDAALDALGEGYLSHTGQSRKQVEMVIAHVEALRSEEEEEP
jgi:adenylosuccinate lyase